MKQTIFITLLFFTSFVGFGQSGAALNFDGTNDYVNLPNVNGPFNISSSHIKTVQIWFKNTTTQGQHVRIFSTGSANWSTGFWLGFPLGSPYLQLELSDGIGAGLIILGSSPIRGDNTWHNATAVFNGSLAALYLDGSVQGTLNISSEGALNSSGSIHIGSSYNNEAASYFQGSVDELRVWDRALCDGEIMATKNCELNGSETGLVAYYKFNHGIAEGNNPAITVLSDFTSNANHGTLINFALSGTVSNWVSQGGVTTGNSCGPFNNPNIGVSSTSTLLCEGSSATLTANGANSYTWTFGPVSNSITVTPSVTTNYTVTGTDNDGCINSAIYTQSVSICDGITSPGKSDVLLNIYPNPFNNSFVVSGNQNTKSVIEVYNSLGALIYKDVFYGDRIEINLAEKKSGIYFVRLINKHGSRSEKIIKH